MRQARAVPARGQVAARNWTPLAHMQRLVIGDKFVSGTIGFVTTWLLPPARRVWQQSLSKTWPWNRRSQGLSGASTEQTSESLKMTVDSSGWMSRSRQLNTKWVLNTRSARQKQLNASNTMSSGAQHLAWQNDPICGGSSWQTCAHG